MKTLHAFDTTTTDKIIGRINSLSAEAKPLWGKMTPAQMFAHLNVIYDMTYNSTNYKVNSFVRFMLKLFVKEGVVGAKPHPKNNRTAPQMLITDEKNFEQETNLFIQNWKKTEKLGKDYFEGRFYINFGKLTAQEWSTLFYKHTDHHFTQFGV